MTKTKTKAMKTMKNEDTIKAAGIGPYRFNDNDGNALTAVGVTFLRYHFRHTKSKSATLKKKMRAHKRDKSAQHQTRGAWRKHLVPTPNYSLY